VLGVFQLSRGADNFLFGNWPEKQCYAAGPLIWYRNSSVPDNNTSQHPGAGQILPIDSHPVAKVKPDGTSYGRALVPSDFAEV
jgi:immune inhibitor A